MADSDGEWWPVAMVAECPPGQTLERLAGSHIVALFNVDGQFFALDGICPHQGGPLGKGRLHDCVVTCPWHGWQFDVATGQSLLAATVRQTSWEVKVDGNQILVRSAFVSMNSGPQSRRSNS